jgi:hypothetical protein
VPTSPTARRPLPVLLAALIGLLAGGCGVLDLGGAVHEAVTLEPATMEGGDWEASVELLATEIGGSVVVVLRAASDEVACADGSAIPPDGVPLGTELVFVQEGEVRDSSPPEVRGLEVAVGCG